MAFYIKDGELYNSDHGIDHDGFTTYNATDEMIRSWGYEPYEATTSDDPVTQEKDRIQNRILELQRHLSETDYISLKYIEGYDCDALYPGWKQQRRELRDMINELEEQVLQLDKNTSEMPVDAPSVIEPTPEEPPATTLAE